MDKNFNEVLKEYDDEFLKGACMELFTLRETGSFPVDQKYFRKLCDERHRMYKDGRNIDAVKSDLLMEIARRWCGEETIEQNWIPVSDPEMEIPKDGNTYWVTRKNLSVDTTFWDMTEWDSPVDDVIAFMRYLHEPKPYMMKD